MQRHILFDYLPSNMKRRFAFLGALVGPIILLLTVPIASADDGVLIIGPEQYKVWFSYGTWKDQPREMLDGIQLEGPNLTGNGGMGRNLKLDLTAHANEPLQLQVQVLPGNETKQLRLLLIDEDETNALWTFNLPTGASTKPVTLTPTGERSLANPQGNNDKPGTVPGLDLAHIKQWQLQGDWQGKPLAVNAARACAETVRLVCNLAEDRFPAIRMKTLGTIFIAFGVFLVVCGVLGYASNPAAAKTALISGSFFGALNIVLGLLLRKGIRWAQWVGLATLGLLIGAFSWRSTVSWQAYADGEPKLVAALLITAMLAGSLLMFGLTLRLLKAQA